MFTADPGAGLSAEETALVRGLALRKYYGGMPGDRQMLLWAPRKSSKKQRQKRSPPNHQNCSSGLQTDPKIAPKSIPETLKNLPGSQNADFLEFALPL